ncbi:MAG: rane dipeptidase [Sphingomonadales bacterium]|nr:rane dipeptidase [Sphingomonadales bacterium]
MDRREFLMSTGAAAAFLTLPGAALPVTRPPADPTIWVDAQGGVDGWDEPQPGRFVPSPKLIEAIRQRRMDLIGMTVGEVGNGPDRFRSAVQSVAEWDALIAEHSAHFAKIESAADIRSARAAGKLGLIYNFQDTTALEGDSARVATFAALGVKQIQLTYNKRNLAGDGCLERANAGLSDFGREVIAKIEEAKVLLDLSHSGQRTIAEGIAAAKRPLAITHSGCRDLVDLPRNTFDAEMRALADKGGVFGLYLMPFIRATGQPQKEDLIRHIEHALKICGEDHIGLGTDGPLFGYEINAESKKRHKEFYEDRVKRGISAPGESADVMNYVEGYNDVGRYESLAADLKGRGWSQARIDKLLGGNFVRLFGEAWG